MHWSHYRVGIIFAALLVLTPILGEYALMIMLGIYALVFGIVSIFWVFRWELRRSLYNPGPAPDSRSRTLFSGVN
jgi:hypothetical protein